MLNTSTPRAAIVVLNYKAIEDTLACIESLMHQSYKDFHIIVVENGSRDTSAVELHKLEKKYPEKITVLYNEHNLGFTGGVNTGIEWAQNHQYPYVALFNNDAIADRIWLESLVTKIETSKELGIVTSLLLRQDGNTIDSTAEQYSTWGLAFPQNRDKPVTEAPQEALIFGATGGASLYRMEMLRDIGVFDESFFAYYEDVDLSFRAQLAGWKIMYTPNAIAYHKQGATSNKMPGGFTIYQTFKNLPLLFTKNVPRGLLFSVGIRFWFAYIMMLGHAIKKGRGWPALKGWIKSIQLFWTSALPARRKIQSNKKVSTAYIRSILWPDLPPDQTGLRKVRKFFTGK